MTLHTQIYPKSKRGSGLTIEYGHVQYQGWDMIVGYVHKGLHNEAQKDAQNSVLCYANFNLDPDYIAHYYPQAKRVQQQDKVARQARIFFENWMDNTSFQGDMYVEGSDFQTQVWRQLLTIPANKNVSYAFVADKIGRPTSYRATANAIGANPICIFIPCHRVIHSDGRITGYSGGIENKKKLLNFEAKSNIYT